MMQAQIVFLKMYIASLQRMSKELFVADRVEQGGKDSELIGRPLSHLLGKVLLSNV